MHKSRLLIPGQRPWILLPEITTVHSKFELLLLAVASQCKLMLTLELVENSADRAVKKVLNMPMLIVSACGEFQSRPAVTDIVAKLPLDDLCLGAGFIKLSVT